MDLNHCSQWEVHGGLEARTGNATIVPHITDAPVYCVHCSMLCQVGMPCPLSPSVDTGSAFAHCCYQQPRLQDFDVAGVYVEAQMGNVFSCAVPWDAMVLASAQILCIIQILPLEKETFIVRISHLLV